jgi:ketosteroid isomerase-like protein
MIPYGLTQEQFVRRYRRWLDTASAKLIEELRKLFASQVPSTVTPTLWKQNSSHRGDATILGGFGGYGEKGWDAVGARYDWASSQYKSGGATMKVEYLNIGVSGDLGFTVAIERQEGARVGDQQNPTRRALRATQVFRKEDGDWKLLHRHADPLIEKQVPSTAPEK